MATTLASLDTERNPCQLLLSSGSTASSFTAPAPTRTRPTAGLVHNLANSIKFALIGVGSEDETVAALVTGYHFEPTSGVYIPGTILQCTGVLGTQTGVLGSPTNELGPDVRFCDEIAVTAATGMPSFIAIEPGSGNSLVKWISVDALDWTLVQIHPIIGTATTANAVVSSF